MRLRERAKNKLKVPVGGGRRREVKECLEVQTNGELQREKNEKKQDGLGRVELRGAVTNVQYL
jgi:hypothetical protein